MKQRDLPIVPTEESEQAALFKWASLAKNVFPELELMHAIPNGGYRPLKTAVAMRKTGTKAGVPDICLPTPKGKYHGMYIEMKRQKGGQLSKVQNEWIKALKEQGYYCCVCRGWEIAVEEIKKYLSQS